MSVLTSYAATLYVDPNSPAASAPYSDWATAARTIQEALDSALAGDEVLVTNGVYDTGARRAVGSSSNRLVMAQAVTLRSVNGPEVTVIQGYQVPGTTNGNNAIRCAYLTNGAVLAGFTLVSGATRGGGASQEEQSGGALWCEPGTAVISNCVITGNSASARGGGVYRGFMTNCRLVNNSVVGGASSSGGGAYGSVLFRCVISNNVSAGSGGGLSEATVFNSWVENNRAIDGAGTYYSALRGCAVTANIAGHDGGGVHNGVVVNCTVTGNSAERFGGGVYYGAATNCIIYRNTATGGSPDYSGSTTPSYCCIPSGWTGRGNIQADPLLASPSHISAESPCRGAGLTNTPGSDIDGEAWATIPSMGCDEPYPAFAKGPVTLAIAAACTNVAPGFPVALAGTISGIVSASRWEFGCGTMESNQPYTSHAWAAAGEYEVILRAYNTDYPDGITATARVHVVDRVCYVAADSSAPSFPYHSWATAANTIQDAVDAAEIPGATILVSNGVYAIGGRVGPAPNLTTNRVAVTKPLVIRSVNGPAHTTIEGYQVPGVTNGYQAVRCIYLTNGAALVGFTLTRGATEAGMWNGYQCGGGAYCEPGAVISNCVLVANSTGGFGGGVNGGTLLDCLVIGNYAAYGGGGAENATLYNCLVVSNSASQGGGAEYCTLTGCLLRNNQGLSSGGAVASSRLYNCVLTSNYGVSGGGAYSSTLHNCLLVKNVGQDGGGSYGGTLINCTLTGNFAERYGHGAFSSTLNNSIVYYNSSETNHHECTMNYCCTVPFPLGGDGNFTNAPLFVDLAEPDSHLQSNSPCINSGRNSYVSTSTDLGGEPRLRGLLVDVGAYEFQNPAAVMPYVWLQLYGLPIDASVDSADPDSDGMNNWQEWVTGTDPTDEGSLLTLVNVAKKPSGVSLTWRSNSGRRYFVLRSTNFLAEPGFSLLATNQFGLPGTTTYTDKTATNAEQYFYRVGVAW